MSELPVNETDILSGPDLKIIGGLLAAPRASVATLGAVAGVSAPTASRRVADLVRDGVVTVVGNLDRTWARTGFAVWLRARCEPGAGRRVAGEIASWPESGYVAITGGEFDCAAQVAVSSSAHLLEVSSRRLRAVRGVTSVSMMRVIRRFATPHQWTASLLREPELAQVRARRRDTWTETADIRSLPMDAVDRRILEALAEDGRLTWRELSARTGISSATAARRTETLMRRGPLRFRAVVEPHRVGKPVVCIVWLRVLPSRLEVAGRTLAEHPDVLLVGATTGAHNLCGEIAVADDDALYEFLAHTVGAIPGVASVEVSDASAVIKRASRVYATDDG